MTVIPFPPRRPGGIVYQPTPRGEILRAVLGGLGKAAAAVVALVVAVAMVLSIIVGGR